MVSLKTNERHMPALCFQTYTMFEGFDHFASRVLGYYPKQVEHVKDLVNTVHTVNI